MILDRYKMNKLAHPGEILGRPAINVIRPLESLFYDFSRTSLQITPFSQKIADFGHRMSTGVDKEKLKPGGTAQWFGLAEPDRSQQKALVANDELRRGHAGYPERPFSGPLGIALLRI